MTGVGKPAPPQTLPFTKLLKLTSFLSKGASILEPSGRDMCDKNNKVQSPVIIKTHSSSNGLKHPTCKSSIHRRWRQEDHEFKVILGYVVTLTSLN